MTLACQLRLNLDSKNGWQFDLMDLMSEVDGSEGVYPGYFEIRVQYMPWKQVTVVQTVNPLSGNGVLGD